MRLASFSTPSSELRHLDAAAFAAPAGMDLRFHDTDGAGKPARHLDCVFGRKRHSAARHGQTKAPEYALRLVLVNIHGHAPSAQGGPPTADG